MSDFAWAVVMSAVNRSAPPEFAIVATSVGTDYIWPKRGPRSELLNADRVQRIAQLMIVDGEKRALPGTAEDWIRVAATNLGYNYAAEPVAVDSLDAAIKAARGALHRQAPCPRSGRPHGSR